MRAEASYANTHFLLPGKVTQISVVGRDQVRGHSVIVVVALSPEGLKRRLFFDAESDLLVKDEQQTEAGMEERFFDDHSQCRRRGNAATLRATASHTTQARRGWRRWTPMLVVAAGPAKAGHYGSRCLALTHRVDGVGVGR